MLLTFVALLGLVFFLVAVGGAFIGIIYNEELWGEREEKDKGADSPK